MMYGTILFFAVVTVAAGDVLRYDFMFRGNRIVGGVTVPIEEFPHQVSLQVYNNHFCGGSILDTNYIITAGHCANYLEHASATVRAGANVTDEGGSVHKILWVKRHEEFGISASGAPKFDIAVAKVSPPFSIDSTRSPITVYYDEEDIEAGQISVISGYGATSEGGGLSRSLKAVKVPIINRKKCTEIYEQNGFPGISEDFICAGTTEGGKDSCQGDSGGPVIVQGQLAGIVSYGLGCARPGIPGVYTNIAYFTKWIADNTP